MKLLRNYLLVVFFATSLGGVLAFTRLDLNLLNKKLQAKEEVEEKPIAKVEDRVRLQYSAMVNDIIKQEYDIIINNVKKTLTIEYRLTTKKDKFQITGKLRDIMLFKYDGSNKDDLKVEDVYSTSYIDAYVSDYNFKIIKGYDDKSYIAILDATDENEKKMYIMDENFVVMNSENPLTVLSKEQLTLESGAGIWYPDTEAMCKMRDDCQIRVKIVGNKIYYLVPTQDDTLEERIYSISDGIIEYRLISTYKIVAD